MTAHANTKTKTKTKQKGLTLTDLEMLQRPTEWPHWPVMPVISLKNPSWGDEYCGLVYAEDKPKVFVNVNMWGIYDLRKKEGPTTWGEMLKGVKTQEYPDFESLLKEWRLD